MNKKMFAIAAVAILIVVTIAAGVSLSGGPGNSGNSEYGDVNIFDINGNPVTFDKPVERVVVYSKYVAEAMIVMGASDRVVGTTSTVLKDSNYKSYYANATDIGTSPTKGMDVVLTLGADVIISHNTEDNSQLANLGIPVLIIGASKIGEVIPDIKVLGQILGMKQEAQKIIDWFEPMYKAVSEYNASANDRSNVKFALESHSKTKLTFSNPTSTPGALLEAVGGYNVFQTTSSTYSYPEGGTLIELNPDVILVVTYNADWNDGALDTYLKQVYAREGWDNINAIKDKDVYMVSNDIVGGIRSIICAMFILSFIDDEYSDVDVSELVNEYNALGGTSFNNKMVYS